MTVARVTIWVGLLAALALPLPAWADPVPTGRQSDRASPYMRVFGVSQPPYGFVKFCDREPDECRQGPQEEQRFSAKPDRLSELDAVNRAVNREIEAATDLEIYGQTEYWTIPTARGDCEDYALLKRHMLMQAGWPREALLITVVRDKNDEGHAVLTVKTNLGEFILDNQEPQVLAWNKTGYKFIKRQSQVDQNTWVALGEPRGAPAYVSAR